MKKPATKDLEIEVPTNPLKKILDWKQKKVECEYSKGKDYSRELYFCEALLVYKE